MIKINDLSGETPAVDQVSGQATIWSELDKWGQSLANWQRFIVSHSVRDGTLGEGHIDDAYRLFLRDKALDAGNEDLPAVPESVTGRAAVEPTPLKLDSLKSLRNVNAISNESYITFSENLTIIYGHNGAGKSGFARVMSSACFSRSRPKIIGNIFDETAQKVPPTARFVIARGNEDSHEVQFTEGDEIGDLQRISVFDSSVARKHIADENDLGFSPAGFDVFDEAIRATSLISKKLDEEISRRDRPNKFGQLFADKGPVADALATLNSKTKIPEILKLGSFGQPEQDRLEEISRQEKELTSESPAETLKLLASAKLDIQTLEGDIQRLSENLGEKACDDARALLAKHAFAIQEAISAGSKEVAHASFKQTGTPVWNDFVLASRNLGNAESEDYPSQDDCCLLCHRPLDAPSVTLINRMWSYLDHSARRAAIAADEELNKLIKFYSDLKLDLLPPESRARADLSKVSPELVSEVDAISSILKVHCAQILEGLKGNQYQMIPSGVPEISQTIVDETLVTIASQEAALEGGRFAELIGKLRAEHIELRQRQVLSKNIRDVEAYILDLVWVERARAAKPTTRFITGKQNTLFQTLIEGRYKEKLLEECEKLNCMLPVEFKARGSAGKTLRRLKVQGGFKPDEIFSEGEQRALSLADFLTEVCLNPASAGIVFDDPVTSLDHQRKRTIAKRLVEEASARQVIIFTHDLVFLSLLSEHSERAGQALSTHWIECLDGVPGCVKIEDSPANSRSYRKTTKAKEFAIQAKKSAGATRVDLIRSGAGALRRTVEEVVIHHLFKETVKRWDEQIRLGALNKIKWSDALADEIVALQAETSRLLEGHSNSDEFSGAMPEVADLESLIIRVDAVIESAKLSR